jgi:muramoyltetrapeptide carboxypeptidase
MITADRPRWPRSLRVGARIALIAPAGPLRDRGEIERAAQHAQSFGWTPIIAEHAGGRRGYFAGTDAERREDLERAFDDRTIDGIWCLRGGYGAVRLLADLDYDLLTRNPKPLLGFSDITALHAVLTTRCALVSFHGPTARQPLSEFSRNSIARALVDQTDSCGVAPTARTIRSGTTRGRLVGGNLALIASLCGTPFAPSFDGAIVVLEDVNEAIYRVDRMLQQLRLAGALDGCAAIAFGHCTACAEESDDGARTLDEVLAETADALGVPCIAGIPMGHIAEQWTLPLGADAELDVDARRLTVIKL